MVATTARDKKKRTKDDDLLLFAMAASGTTANTLDGEGIIDDLLTGFFPNPTYSGSVATAGNPLNDIIAGAPSLTGNLAATLGATVMASSIAASVFDHTKKPAVTPDTVPPNKKGDPALHADLESDAARKANPALDADGPAIKAGHSRFGSIFSVAATATTLGVVAMSSATGENEPAAPAHFNFFVELGHFAHIVGHGLQNGVVGLLGAPEDILDMVDSWTGENLIAGDSKTNSTTEVVGKFADEYIIEMPELRNDFERAAHGVAEFSTYLVPVGTAAKLAGFSARAITAARALDVSWDIASLNSMGLSLTGENIPQLAGDFAQKATKTVADMGKVTPAPASNAPAQTFDMA